MNISNNLRFQTTEEKIYKALVSLLHFRNYNDISIKELCYEAGINRSSFYAHFDDINDLMIKIEQRLSKNMDNIFDHGKKFDREAFTNMFEFLYENRTFYKAYLTTAAEAYMERNDFLSNFEMLKSKTIAGYGQTELLYHMAFFAGGLKSISKAWILRGCKESPEDMSKYLYNEYNNASKYMKDNKIDI